MLLIINLRHSSNAKPTVQYLFYVTGLTITWVKSEQVCDSNTFCPQRIGAAGLLFEGKDLIPYGSEDMIWTHQGWGTASGLGNTDFRFGSTSLAFRQSSLPRLWLTTVNTSSFTWFKVGGLGLEFKILGLRLRSLRLGVWGVGCGVQVLGCGVKGEIFGLVVWGLEFRFWGVGCIEGLGFMVWGLRFKVQDLGLWLQG